MICNSRRDDALTEAGRLRAHFVGRNGYALAYGSHAVQKKVSNSDLDLLFVGPPLNPRRAGDLVRAVIDLHHSHKLRLDAEVAYDVKLHATDAEVATATSLSVFPVDPMGDLHVPPVIDAPWFLNSAEFKHRLTLNALTSPHIFLGGQVDRYREHRTRAERALALLALSLLDTAAFTVPQAAAALLIGPNGAAGKDFLGYSHRPALHSVLQLGLAHLISEKVVRGLDGAHFEQQHDARRACIGALRAHGGRVQAPLGH